MHLNTLKIEFKALLSQLVTENTIVPSYGTAIDVGI